MANITLPDGSVKQLPDGSSVLDLANSIGKRLAQAAVAIASTAPLLQGAPSARVVRRAALQLSSQEPRLPGRNLKEKVENLIAYGGSGLELMRGFDPREALDAIKGTPIKISAICAADGPYIVPYEKQRRKAIDNAKHLLELAGEVNSTGVIMVPAFNNAKDQLQGHDAHKMLIDILHELGEHGEKHNSRMMLEPLNRREAWFLRQLAYAASICQEVNSPGVAMMGDMYHMNFEEPSDQAAFMSAGPYLHHVHLASTKRNLPGQDDRSFVDGFRGLKRIGFDNYMSLECGVIGDREVEIPKSFKFLKEQWEQATV
jgi:sugar phosphate isomerase/epimerase